MIDKIRGENTDSLFNGILKLKTIDECYTFFDDLCTVKEIQAITQRFAVAKMLKQNCVYSDIVEKTGASTATISRVNRSLLYGNDGYNVIFDRLNK